MFLNRSNREAIQALRKAAEAAGHTLAMTHSRFDGRYLDSLRIYRNGEDVGKPTLAIWVGYAREDIEERIAAYAIDKYRGRCREREDKKKIKSPIDKAE